jgi:hypothetical protein
VDREPGDCCNSGKDGLSGSLAGVVLPDLRPKLVAMGGTAAVTRRSGRRNLCADPVILEPVVSRGPVGAG